MRLVMQRPSPKRTASDFGGLVGRSRNCDVEPAWTEGFEKSQRADPGGRVSGGKCDPAARTPRPGSYAKYGKGLKSKAGLNYGDCFSYALAKVTGAPLLFKGGDFSETDITSALARGESTERPA